MLNAVCLVFLWLCTLHRTDSCNLRIPLPPLDPLDSLPSNCRIKKEDRHPCGWPRGTVQECKSRGCCFDLDFIDGKNCFYPKNTWGSWGGWESCSKTCGGGSQYRHRICLADGSCSGSSTEHKSCNTHQCPGEWSSWGSWTACSKSCGSGTQSRSRSCLKGGSCIGSSFEHRSCNMPQCPREWSNWSGWGDCTTTCGQGLKHRTRTCSDGSGPTCDGGASQIISCNYNIECPGRHLVAVHPGKETLKALKELSNKRPQLISMLHKVAIELRKEQHSADVHHIISSGTSIVGYVLMGISVISEVMTVGADTPLAVPLFTLGEVMVSGGTLASVISNIVDDLKKSSTLREAENIFQQDSNLSNNLKEWTWKMESLAQSSDQMIVSAEIVEEFGINIFRQSVVQLITLTTKEVLVSAGKLPMVVETVTSKMTGAALNVWDLVVSSIHIAKGSPSEAANKIDQIADHMESDNRVLQQKLQQLREHLFNEIKYNLQNPDTDTPERVQSALEMLHAILNWNPDWINIFNDPNSGMTLPQFIINILQPYFNEIGRKIEEERQRGNRPERMDVGIIAHGSIGSSLTSPNPWETSVLSSTPVSLHFATESLRSITFYQPWGSMLHANAAHRR